MAPSEPLVLVHDYLTQRGGAERVVLEMAQAFPSAPLWTSLYDPPGTFQEFGKFDIQTTWLDRIPTLRHHHRLALPLLAGAFGSLRIDAPTVLCSSSGWAHGVVTEGRKIVYCHSPARWLYHTDLYLGGRGHGRRGLRQRAATAAEQALVTALKPKLLAWDQRAAASADRYLVASSLIQRAVKDLYGIDAELLPPPPALDPHGPLTRLDGVEPGFWLCVSRLMPYKNVDVVVRAVTSRPGERLVVVGDGPQRAALAGLGNGRVRFAGRVDDDTLRWCYANCRGLVAASYEDFGLTPLEAAAFGKPSAVLRFGGFLDTTVAGKTGCFFDRPEPHAVSRALDEVAERTWDPEVLIDHAGRYDRVHFTARLNELVEGDVAYEPPLDFRTVA